MKDNYDNVRLQHLITIGAKYMLVSDGAGFLAVDNVFDKDPPIATGTGFGGSVNGGTNAVFYDTMGRYFKVGVSASF